MSESHERLAGERMGTAVVFFAFGILFAMYFAAPLGKLLDMLP